MNDAKIRLSEKEMELITNANWILTKNAILKKTDHFLAALQVTQKKVLDSFNNLPVELMQSSPKISKGENYNGLPYRMLDFPKIFTQSEIFAIRTMFWWGNFFSITIHLSGNYKKLNQVKLIDAYSKLKESGFYCCVNKDQWEHHFETSNYIPIYSLTKSEFESIITENPFCKLAYKMPIRELNNTQSELITYFKKIIELFAD